MLRISGNVGQGLFDTRFGIPGDYEARRCQQCGLEQLSPIPTAARLKDLYERYYNFGGEHDTLYTRFRERFFSSPLHRLWAFLDGDISFYTRRGVGRLLDIGCNEGRGLTIYSRSGYKVEGLELNETAAAVARRKGFAVHTATLERFAPDTLFDVAVLSNVLEHSLDPAQMFRDVRRILKPGARFGSVALTAAVGCAPFSRNTGSTGMCRFISFISHPVLSKQL